MNAFQIHTDGRGVMTITFDTPGKSVNTFTPEALDELASRVDALHDANDPPAAVIFTSGKDGAFIAGADLFAMREMDTSAMRTFLEKGQRTFDAIAALPMPTVAAINGNCMGGGCELALACDHRVMVDDGSMRVGLPEINLGIIPAWGGTTRMARMFGLAKSLPTLLAGKTFTPRKAKSVGLVDDVVRSERLQAAARRLLVKRPDRPKPNLLDRAARSFAPLAEFICSKARAAANAKTFGNYPAPDRLIDTARAAVLRGHDVGLTAERDSVIELASGPVCRNLMRLFFLRQGAKRVVREKLDAPALPVKQVAVVGGGTMGAGITAALVKAGYEVRLIDINPDFLSAALNRINKDLQADVKAKRMTRIEAERAMDRVSPTARWARMHRVDFAIEAVSERPEIKQEIFAKLEKLTRPDCVLASNTSSLDITAFAAERTHPSRVIGLHFFNPVSKMPLVEVIATDHATDAALATGFDLALAMGKTPVLVNDAPGFLVNRVLFPYLAEAMVLLGEGCGIKAVDTAMKRWGMPMGPFELLDTVGLDVAADIFTTVSARLGDHLAQPRGLDEAIGRGWHGRKSGHGFYDYTGKGKPTVNEDMAELLRDDQASHGELDADADAWRCVLPMVNEAARALREGVTDSTETVDLATVLGLGLAPFRGGLCKFADDTGLAEIVARMDELAERHGPRFAPISELREAAADGQSMQSITDAGVPTHSKTKKRKSPISKEVHDASA